MVPIFMMSCGCLRNLVKSLIVARFKTVILSFGCIDKEVDIYEQSPVVGALCSACG